MDLTRIQAQITALKQYIYCNITKDIKDAEFSIVSITYSPQGELIVTYTKGSETKTITTPIDGSTIGNELIRVEKFSSIDSTTSPNSLIFVSQPEGVFGLPFYKPVGLYSWDGTQWISVNQEVLNALQSLTMRVVNLENKDTVIENSIDIIEEELNINDLVLQYQIAKL